MPKREIKCKHKRPISECLECYPVFLQETTVGDALDTMHDNKLDVIAAMEKYGGSFVVALAGAFRTADAHNFIKLKTTFRGYWDQYAKMVESE